MTTDETVGTLAQRVERSLRDIPDFPAPGVVFKDVTPVLADGALFGDIVRDMAGRYAGLGIGFVPVRKAGKLPGVTASLSYDLEYGSATIEVHEDAFVAGQRVLVVDDVLATGGTADAACRLVEQVGGEVVAFETLVELAFLDGRERLDGREVYTTVTVSGD